MTSHDACISGTFRILAVASVQRLKLEALIPVSADGELRSVIKFLNVQTIALIEIHDTRLVFGEIRCQISVQTKLTGVLFVFTSAIKANVVLYVYYHEIFNH